MTDPHVEWLEYGLKTGWLFDNPPPLVWQTPAFKANLIDGVFRAEPLEHFATVEEARAAIEPFIQGWEIDLAMRFGQRPMTFEFNRANVVDRNPSTPGSVTIITATTRLCASFSAAGEHKLLKDYPPVPSKFKADPDVITLWTRFEGFKNGQEPLGSMAYFCFTFLRDRYRGSPTKVLNVAEPVLKKVGELSTNRGDDSNARKVTSSLTPFSPAEAQWLEEAIRVLIRRVGEIAAGHSPQQLTMTDLPRL